MAKGVELLGRYLAQAAVAQTVSSDDVMIGVGNDIKVGCYANTGKPGSLRVMLSGDFDDLTPETARNLADCIIGICDVREDQPSADEIRRIELGHAAQIINNLLEPRDASDQEHAETEAAARLFVARWKV